MTDHWSDLDERLYRIGEWAIVALCVACVLAFILWENL